MIRKKSAYGINHTKPMTEKIEAEIVIDPTMVAARLTLAATAGIKMLAKQSTPEELRIFKLTHEELEQCARTLDKISAMIDVVTS